MEELPFDTNEELVTYSKRNESKLLIICFTATWCQPCKILKEYLKELNDKITDNNSNEYNPRVEIYTLNIDDDDKSEIIETYDVSKIPNLMFFKQGFKIESMLGTKETNEIPNRIKLYLS
tara:strand:+ start:67 stop:426 length:360 start_codon:yes stop_codon:yes gene_type:complete